MDKTGPDTLTNSWLNIHPNCLHQLMRWTPMGRSAEEIQKIKDFSSFQKNPLSRDPCTQKQVDAYRQKEQDRARWLRDYRQWERYRETLGDAVPRTFRTFQKHKRARDETFQGWKDSFREAKDLEKYSSVRYHDDETIVVTDDWTQKERPKLNKKYRLNAVVDTLSQGGKIFWKEMPTVTVSRFQEIMLCNEPEFSYQGQDYSICSPNGKYYVTASDSPGDWELEFSTLEDLLDFWRIQGRPLREILPELNWE